MKWKVRVPWEYTAKNSKQIKKKSVYSSTITDGEIKWTNKNWGKTSKASEIIKISGNWITCYKDM